jgi:hypothetical protein
METVSTGHADVPFNFPGEVPLVLDFDRLHFGERAAGLGSRPDPDPRKLPAIRVDLRGLYIRCAQLWPRRAEFSRGTTGMTLNKFTMAHPSSPRRGAAAG